MVLQAELAQHRAGQIVDHHYQVAQIFVVNESVDSDRENAYQPVIDQLDAEQALEIQAGLDARIAFRKLDADTGGHDHRFQQHLDQEQREQLGEKHRAVRDGKRVHDFVNAGIALAPDELAGVERDDDEHE